MNSINTYNIYYDKESDFLEISLGEASECHAEEIEPGVFIRKDEKTDKIKSIGILNFKKRVQILKELLERNNLEIPLDIRAQ